MSIGASTGTPSKPIRTLYLLGHYVYWETIYWGTIYIHWDTIYNGSYMYFLGHIKGNKSIGTISAGTQYLIIPTVLGHYLLRTLRVSVAKICS